MRACLALITLFISFHAAAMCLDDHDFKSVRFIKNASVNTPFGVFHAAQIVYRYNMSPEALLNEDRKIDYLCKLHHGQDFSYAHVIERRTPSRSPFSADFYIEAYNSLRQLVRLPVVWYSGNTIGYACLRPNGKRVCQDDR